MCVLAVWSHWCASRVSLFPYNECVQVIMEVSGHDRSALCVWLQLCMKRSSQNVTRNLFLSLKIKVYRVQIHFAWCNITCWINVKHMATLFVMLVIISCSYVTLYALIFFDYESSACLKVTKLWNCAFCTRAKAFNSSA